MSGPPKKLKTTIPLPSKLQTLAEAYPPLEAWSETAKAAVQGTNDSNGNGVYGKSKNGDGIHGESDGAAVSGVAGIHTASGNGVYGRSTGGNAGNFDGKVQVNGDLTVTGDVYLSGGDCAEQFDFVGSKPEPGSLVVIDGTGALRESQNKYDRKVVGVVAGAGTYRPGIVLDKHTTGRAGIVVSLMGKVYCKVDASYGPVEVGDLLTSSPAPGYAMKASDSAQAFGAVVGKALRPLESGQDLIPILIALQ
jgi:hypothetical protein